MVCEALESDGCSASSASPFYTYFYVCMYVSIYLSIYLTIYLTSLASPTRSSTTSMWSSSWRDKGRWELYERVGEAEICQGESQTTVEMYPKVSDSSP